MSEWFNKQPESNKGLMRLLGVTAVICIIGYSQKIIQSIEKSDIALEVQLSSQNILTYDQLIALCNQHRDEAIREIPEDQDEYTLTFNIEDHEKQYSVICKKSDPSYHMLIN
jgi:hypothetical protein